MVPYVYALLEHWNGALGMLFGVPLCWWPKPDFLY
jgi:hypothetical protein